jgi:hypothetical protein
MARSEEHRAHGKAAAYGLSKSKDNAVKLSAELISEKTPSELESEISYEIRRKQI